MTDFNVPVIYCANCKTELMPGERVIYSHKETFTFKPASVPDEPLEIPGQDGKLRKVSAAAVLTPMALAERRKDYQKTAVVNTFGVWGKMAVPPDAFYFRHQWCEPVRTGAGATGGLHPLNKHAVRYQRSMVKRSHY